MYRKEKEDKKNKRMGRGDKRKGGWQRKEGRKVKRISGFEV